MWLVNALECFYVFISEENVRVTSFCIAEKHLSVQSTILKLLSCRFSMEPSEDSPLSLWMVRAAELFPKLSLEKDDDELNVPFNERKTKKKSFSSVAQFSHFHLLAIFSCRRERKVSRSVGEWRSCHFQLQTVHSALNKAVRSIDSYKIDRDSADQGHFPTHHWL